MCLLLDEMIGFSFGPAALPQGRLAMVISLADFEKRRSYTIAAARKMLPWHCIDFYDHDEMHRPPASDAGAAKKSSQTKYWPPSDRVTSSCFSTYGKIALTTFVSFLVNLRVV